MKRVKVSAGLYHIVHQGSVIAEIAKTGTRRDNYPWNWYLEYGLQFKPYIARDGKLHTTRSYGTGDSLKACTNTIMSKVEQYGVENGDGDGR